MTGAAVPKAVLDPAAAPVRRSRTVLYLAIAAAVLAAVLVALLASAKPSSSAASSPLIGRSAPAVSGPTVTGNATASLASMKGKWVLVNFAASWCIPCREETPQLLAFEKQHAATGDAAILGVAFDPTDTSRLASFLTSSGATWPAVADPSADVSYGVTGIPESYLVDPAGRVVAKFVGGITAAQVNGVIDRATS